MLSIFDTIIDSYLATEVGICDSFLDKDLCANLILELHNKLDNNEMHKAGIGAKKMEQHDANFRSDKIFWLDRKHGNDTENAFLDAMDVFIQYLNSTCFAGITHCEFHYAMYEKGNFYGKHKDQFVQNIDRAFSMIHYLNPHWQQGDGGELNIVYKTHEQLIAPILGKSVFFKSSDLTHEVLQTNTNRLSITGWLKTGG